MKRLLILIATALVTASCVNTSTEDKKYFNYQIVDKNSKWVTYKVDEIHFLCVPNYNADKGAVPVILEVKKK